MDLSSQLTSYASSISFKKLPKEAVHQAKRILVDTLACAIGGFSADPCRWARELAAEVSNNRAATVLGTKGTSSPDMAAFANGIAIRYLDYNDTYVSEELGHPSDDLAAILAAGEAAHASGEDSLTAIVLAYEVFCNLCDAVCVRSRGFDYVTLSTISATLASAKLLGLSPKQMRHALHLGITPNIALFQTRLGEVSMWKACAAANASRNAIFASLLATQGFTAPSEIFEGPGGFFRAVAGAPFTLGTFGSQGKPLKVMQTNMKRFPVGYLAQTALEAALDLRPQIHNPGDIASVEVHTAQGAIDIMADAPGKWRPANRETADHSIPYAVGVALMYGTVEVRHFSEQYLTDAALLDLIQKVRVIPSEEANRMWPEMTLSVVELKTRSGDRLVSRVPSHHGHAKSPMSDADLEEKFRDLAKDYLTPKQTRTLLDLIWNVERVEDIGQLVQEIQLQ